MRKQAFFRVGMVSILALMTLVLSGCGLRDQTTSYVVDLEIWGAFDDSDAYQEAISAYRNLNPHVRITYRKFPVDTYKQDVLDALAAGNGPDIFMVRNSWTPAFSDKIVAASAEMIDERTFRDALVDVAADDFVANGAVLGVPLSVDSLGLYYNKDLLGAAGIPAPPATWEEFLDDVRLLTRIDSFGNITQSGAALGTSENINRSTDVLNALFLQNGLALPLGKSAPVHLGTSAGSNALDFYTQFANPTSSIYTWNPRMHYSIDAFYEGTAAMMVNYSWHYDTIRRKNAKLNFATAPLPQLSGKQPFNFANYWGFVVSKNKQAPEGTTDRDAFEKARQHEAWEFLKFLALPNNGTITLSNALTGASQSFSTQYDPANDYLTHTKKPAARRDLAGKQHTDPVFGPFADGNLVARNWYQTDPESIESILAEAITDVNYGRSNSYQALSTAENRINQLERK